MEKTQQMLLLILVIGLVGCTSRSSNMQVGDENYRSGTQGLQFDFAPYSPPDRIFDDENLQVRVDLTNIGAEDLTGSANRIYLSGFDSAIITGIPTAGITVPALEGKKFYNPEGGFDSIEFTGMVRDLKAKNIAVYEPTLMLTACYKYRTIADPSICIDPDPFSSTTSLENKVCDFRNQPALGSQGAPIAVNDVQVEAQEGKSRFKIFVQNVGGGDTLKESGDVLSRCNPYDPTGIEFDDIDFVHVDDVAIGSTSIVGSCKPLEDGYLRLRSSGAGFMICEVDGLVGPAYTTPLRITISYNYRDTVSKTIKIIQTP
jgi:hypothetical protein